MRSTTGRLLRGYAVMLIVFWVLLVVGGFNIGLIEFVLLAGILVAGLVAYTTHVQRTAAPGRPDGSGRRPSPAPGPPPRSRHQRP